MATTTRKKKVLLPTTITKDQAEAAFGDYAKADAKKHSICAKMDIEITKIRDKYQDDINALDEQRTSAFEVIQTYAINNRDDFGNRKSMEMAHGSIGFRTGTPKLKTAKGFTWASTLTLVQALLPAYTRKTVEIAKDKILANRTDEKLLAELPKVGIIIDQDETFFVEPKKELESAV